MIAKPFAKRVRALEDSKGIATIAAFSYEVARSIDSIEARLSGRETRGEASAYARRGNVGNVVPELVDLVGEFINSLPDGFGVRDVIGVLQIVDRFDGTHKSSPSVGAVLDTASPTVGLAAGTDDSPSGVSAAPSGGSL